jgi:hypothetical protein
MPDSKDYHSARANPIDHDIRSPADDQLPYIGAGSGHAKMRKIAEYLSHCYKPQRKVCGCLRFISRDVIVNLS